MQNNDNNNKNDITPDMLKDFLNVIKSSSQSSNLSNILGNKSDNSSNSTNSFSSTSSKNSNSNTTANDFEIDFNTILKIKSVIEQLNKKDDPRTNLLYSLKPYLNKKRQQKLDQYANLLKIGDIASLFNDQKKGDEN